MGYPYTMRHDGPEISRRDLEEALELLSVNFVYMVGMEDEDDEHAETVRYIADFLKRLGFEHVDVDETRAVLRGIEIIGRKAQKRANDKARRAAKKAVASLK